MGRKRNCLGFSSNSIFSNGLLKYSAIYGSRYSRIDQVKFVKGSLSRPYHFKFFKVCVPQNFFFLVHCWISWSICYIWRPKLKQSPGGVYKLRVLKNLAKIVVKSLCQSLFFNKVAGLQPPTSLKIDIKQVFLWIFSKFLAIPVSEAATGCAL